MRAFQVGTARSDITPPAGLNMMGYSRRVGISTGVHDPLHCRALVMSDGETHWAIAVCDLLCFAQELCDPIAAHVSEVTGIPAEHVWVCATHTHSAPFFNLWKSPSSPDGSPQAGRDRAWEHALPQRIAETVVAAWDSREPATVAFAQGTADIGANRRCPTADGGVRLIPYDAGPADHTVSVMAIGDAHGRPVSLLVNHACHGVILTEDNLQYTADWLGLCAGHLEREHVPGVALVAQGTCGNIDPRQRGSFALADTAARAVADAAWSAVAGAEFTTDVTLRVAKHPVTLELRDTASAVARGEAHVAQVERNIACHVAPDSTHTQRLQDELRLAQEGLGSALALRDSNQRFPRADMTSGTLQCALRVMHINGHPFVGVPGEVFTEFSLAVRQMAAQAPVFVFGYCHDYIGYVPTRAAYEEGGYEVQSSRVAPGGHERLVEAAKTALTPPAEPSP